MQIFRKKETQTESERHKWTRLLQEQNESGQTIAEYCRGKDIEPQRFYNWKHRLQKKKTSAFIPTIIKPESSTYKTQKKEAPAQRLCSLEIGDTGRLVIESTEALQQIMGIIERKL